MRREYPNIPTVVMVGSRSEPFFHSGARKSSISHSFNRLLGAAADLPTTGHTSQGRRVEILILRFDDP